MKNKISVKLLSWLAMLIALSAVGASIKIPSPVGSIALDSFPAIMAAAILGGGSGAVVGSLGHLVSAELAGFPLGAMHFLIAAEMAVLVWLFGIIYKRNQKLLAAVIFVLGNGLLAPLPFILLINKEFYIATVPFLLVASVINVVLALVVIPKMKSIISTNLKQGEVKE
ncbi:ECF transporter S component [Bacillus sp. BRMEA1]|uniref:ECF transporter S component n=1 Tax=Neobacillus endophyticus TaxID=2738405 RepID=UPI00156321DF|nr:ECF transporter S component [Neobacillus endophyticus]NRD79321.1 ECF transporter S component [Neobacillus endophyticus]